MSSHPENSDPIEIHFPVDIDALQEAAEVVIRGALEYREQGQPQAVIDELTEYGKSIITDNFGLSSGNLGIEIDRASLWPESLEGTVTYPDLIQFHGRVDGITLGTLTPMFDGGVSEDIPVIALRVNGEVETVTVGDNPKETMTPFKSAIILSGITRMFLIMGEDQQAA